MTSEYTRVFRAFTDEHRVRILEMLREGERCACELLHELDISQPTLSHHMKILIESGIVRARRAGKWSYYAINAEGCDYAKRLLARLAEGDLPLTLRISRALGKALGVLSALGKAPVERPRPCRCARLS